MILKKSIHNSLDFDRCQCDEGKVDVMLSKFNLYHQKIPANTLDYHSQYTLDFLYTLSPYWPIGFTFAVLLPMLEKMKLDGKKIVVSGQGGDHLFTGSPYVLQDLLARFKIFEFHKELRTYRYPWKALKHYVLKPMLGEDNVKRINKFIGKETTANFWDNCEIRDLVEGLGLRRVSHKEDLDMLTSAYHSTVMDGNIFHCAERYFGIEYRHPFFNLEFVEFALSLPPEMKYGNKTIKRILRKAMRNILPEEIRCRKDKAEFSEILKQQIEAIDIDKLLENPNIVALEIVTKEDISYCIDRYRRGERKFVSYLWVLINVEYWYVINRFDD